MGARLAPRITMTPTLVRVMNRLAVLRGVPRPPTLPDVAIRDVRIPARDGTQLRVRLYQPARRLATTPGLLWIHGGGFMLGSPEQDEAANLETVRQLGVSVAAVSYRLAPKWPFPAPLEDCYSALHWLHGHAAPLGIDSARIAVGGASAGGGLAAALAQLAHHRGEVPLAFQLLVYPMLDDRTALRVDIDPKQLRLWTQSSNVHGWTAYLGHAPGRPEVKAYAVPARLESLRGLPPAWIGIGTCDLFHAEALAYAQRLSAAEVACELHVVPGAFHGFDFVSPKAQVVRAFRQSYRAALKRALADRCS
jgi:acetyl esterase/lipase